MGSVHVRIGHDDDLVVAQLGDVKIVVDARPEGGDHGFDLRVTVNPIQARLLHVEDLSSQGKNGLGALISGVLGGAAGRVSLHQEDLAVLRVLVGAVRQLAGQGHPLQSRLSPGQVPGLSGCRPGSLGEDGLLQHGLGHRRILLQKIGELLADHAVHRAPGLAVSQLLLGLALKLGLADLDADDGRQTLSYILSGQAVLAVL